MTYGLMISEMTSYFYPTTFACKILELSRPKYLIYVPGSSHRRLIRQGGRGPARHRDVCHRHRVRNHTRNCLSKVQFHLCALNYISSN